MNIRHADLEDCHLLWVSKSMPYDKWFLVKLCTICHSTYVADGGAVKKRVTRKKPGDAAGACDEEGTINNTVVYAPLTI